MKQFLKKIGYFILPLLLLAVGSEALLRHIPNDYVYKKIFLDSAAQKIEVLYLGSSHVYFGLNPEYSHFKSFNAAYISQSLNFDLALLKKYENRWSSLKYIVVPVDYFTLYKTLEIGAESWRVKNYNLYYGIHTSYTPAGNSELFSNTFKVNVTKFKKYYRRHESPITCSSLGWGNKYHSFEQQDLVVTGREAAKRHSATGKESFDENLQSLNQIIAFAKAKNIKVLLFTSPVYETYLRHLNKRQLQQTVDAANSIAHQNDNVAYFNLLTNASFISNDFYDADHLNEIGARKLTMKVDSLLSVIK